MEECILQINNISKSFGKVEVLHDINMSIEKGCVYGLIGQNGAGKTTLLRLLAGLMKPTKGTTKLHTEKSYIGYMPQICRFDDNMTVAETLGFFSKLKESSAHTNLPLAERLKLDLNKKVKYLSPGQQKKLQMIIAMNGDPDMYILDEPTAGLDPSATSEMKNIIKDIHAKKKSIIISSHILQDMDDICTNVAIMENGRITYNRKIDICYIIKTSLISDELFGKMKKQYTITLDPNKTTLIAKIKKNEIPKLIGFLCSNDVNVFEVILSNVKNIVEKQLQLEEAGYDS